MSKVRSILAVNPLAVSLVKSVDELSRNMTVENAELVMHAKDQICGYLDDNKNPDSPSFLEYDDLMELLSLAAGNVPTVDNYWDVASSIGYILDKSRRITKVLENSSCASYYLLDNELMPLLFMDGSDDLHLLLIELIPKEQQTVVSDALDVLLKRYSLPQIETEAEPDCDPDIEIVQELIPEDIDSVLQEELQKEPEVAEPIGTLGAVITAQLQQTRHDSFKVRNRYLR